MLITKLKKLIVEEEKYYVDFKATCGAFISRDKRPNVDLIIDICSMSNNHKRASYIIIGVSDDGKNFHSVSNSKLTDHNLQNLCSRYINPPPKIKLLRFKWQDASACKDIVVIQIGPHLRNIYHLALDNIDYNNGICHRENEVWIRRGTMNALASPSEILQLGEGINYGDKIRTENNLPYARSQNAVKTDDKNFHTLVAAGIQHERTKRHDLAIECFEKALKQKQNDIGLHLVLSGIYGEGVGGVEGKKKAIAHCRKAIKIDKKNYSGWFNLAVYTNHLKGASESLPIYQKAERLIISQGLQGSEIEGKLNLFIGHDYRDTGNKLETRNRYDKAISILQKLASAGNMSAAFWLEDAKVNLKKLLEDMERRAERDLKKENI